jgi:GDPmannose 4,6-dehydratase
MNALIFGANGQDGYYLGELCQQREIAAIGVSRSPGHWLQGDITNYTQVESLVKHYQPTYVFHLAAQSTTRHSALFDNHATIATGSLNVLEAVYRHSPHSKVFITGSGVQFQNDGQPISATTPFAATSPYAVARIHSVYAARYYRSLGIPVYVGYLFHHESPLRKSNHVSQMVVQAALQICRGEQTMLTIGDLSVEKEWTFAGDVVRGMLTLVEQDQVFEATIGSGQAYRIQDWVEVCFAKVGLDWREHIESIPDFRSEYPRLVSDPTVMQSLGWAPMVSLPELATLMLNAASLS